MNLCFTVEEAARVVGAKIGHIYYLAYIGRIEGWKIRGAWRLFSKSVEAYAQRRNQEAIDDPFTRDPDDQGCGRVPSLFAPDDPPDDMGSSDTGLPNRQRMEHSPSGLPLLPIKAFKPVAQSRQLELFAEAV